MTLLPPYTPISLAHGLTYVGSGLKKDLPLKSDLICSKLNSFPMTLNKLPL